jgi:uncharacterized protein YlxW (UPF0749 family)
MPEPAPAGRRSVLRALLRPSRTHLVVAVILMLAGLGITLQVRTLATQQDYSTLRRSELIGILDDLTAESRRLEAQIADLEQTRDELRSGVDSRQVAREEAARRQEELEILAGTIPARGTGVRVVIDDPQARVGAAILLNALSELRDAGTERPGAGGRRYMGRRGRQGAHRGRGRAHPPPQHRRDRRPALPQRGAELPGRPRQ